MIRIPLALRVWGLVLSVVLFYGWIGQTLPQRRIEAPPPPETSTAGPASRPGPVVGEGNHDPSPPPGFQDGKRVYDRTCFACHGDGAEGKAALNAPRLAGQEDWYIRRQLENFASGARGSDPKDVYGLQMRSMAVGLQEDEIADVATYLSSLE